MWVCVSICEYMWVYVSICVYMYTCIYVYVYVYMCICVSVYMCICVYVYMCICLCYIRGELQAPTHVPGRPHAFQFTSNRYVGFSTQHWIALHLHFQFFQLFVGVPHQKSKQLPFIIKFQWVEGKTYHQVWGFPADFSLRGKKPFTT